MMGQGSAEQGMLLGTGLGTELLGPGSRYLDCSYVVVGVGVTFTTVRTHFSQLGVDVFGTVNVAV